MTLHPLTKELISVRSRDLLLLSHEEAIDKIVRGYLIRRKKWLEIEFKKYGYENTIKSQLINQAFQLAPETLEEKFKAIRLKHDSNHPSPEAFWDAVLKEFAKTAEEHFNNQPCNGKQV